MNINQTYCIDHFTLYTNIEGLCCTPDTNVICQLSQFLKNYNDEKIRSYKKEANGITELKNTLTEIENILRMGSAEPWR